MSFWEKVGETIGHGIGAIVYGPGAAMKQRHLKTIRRAFATWLGGESYTKQIAEPGKVRRLVERQDDELTFLLECELRPEHDDAQIVITLV